MNKIQWFVLAFGFMLIGLFFIYEDSQFRSCLEVATISEELDSGDVWCIINGEIRDPFIPVTYFLFILFMICGFLEPSQKKKH